MNATEAVYTALTNHLKNRSVWGDRVFADSAPARIVRPYVVFFVASGGDAHQTQKQDARMVLTVKCVADKLNESLQGADALTSALSDTGSQDDRPILCEGWNITTITQDRIVHLKEMWEGATPIYHDGYQFIVTMERK